MVARGNAPAGTSDAPADHRPLLVGSSRAEPLAGGDGSDEVLLEAVGLEKWFGGVHALRGASLDLVGGRVHGLLGQNGSGKSTMLRVLSGQIAPDGGRLVMGGVEVRLSNPARALAAGVAIVSQELTLAPDLSVAENVCLASREPRRWHGVGWRGMRERTHRVLKLLGLEVDPSVPVGGLRADQQQLVEIGRALSTQARILILDEPTSSLSDDEVERLFTVVRTLRGRGVAVVLVTHRIDEVFQIVDEVTVLRDGRAVVAGARLAELDASKLVHLMTGMAPVDAKHERGAHEVDEPVLRVRGLAVPGVLEGVDVDVGAGEVVGVAGLMGSGRSELLAAVFGTVARAGEVVVDGRGGVCGSPRAAIAAGVGYVPADRTRQGLVLNMALMDNVALASTAEAWRLGWPARRRERRVAEEALERFGIVARGPEAPVWTLSGGNQQKVLLAKWLTTRPRLLLLDEPTRGVDAAAKTEIHRLLIDARQEGLGMLISSSEASELQALCDRVIVLHRGQVAAHLAGSESTEAALLHHAMG